MFNFFKKREIKKPDFTTLMSFAEKDKYFHRVALWDWLNDSQIHVYDPHGPRLITMDDWPQIIFLDSKGQLTVREYVDYMATLYKRNIPEKLDETIINELKGLIDLKLIEYSSTSISLQEKFDIPLSQQKK